MFSRVFSLSPKGPMPLMANLMLSTRRAIVNHPHYEDVALRQKTRKVYQMYSRRSPEEYKQTLKELQVHYVVLHSGWCLEKPWVYTKNNRIWKKNMLVFFREINSATKIFVKMIFQICLPKKTKPKVPDDFTKKKKSLRKEIFFIRSEWYFFSIRLSCYCILFNVTT